MQGCTFRVSQMANRREMIQEALNTRPGKMHWSCCGAATPGRINHAGPFLYYRHDPSHLPVDALTSLATSKDGQPKIMDPASILTIVATSLSVIVKTSTCLKELSQKYRSVGQDITLLIVKLNTVEAIMSQISCWLESETLVEKQMVSDINTAVAACEFVVREIYNHVHQVRDGWLGGRIRHMWTEDQLNQHQRSLDSQISALGVLLNVAVLRNQSRQIAPRRKVLPQGTYEDDLDYYFNGTPGRSVDSRIGVQRMPDDALETGGLAPSGFYHELLQSNIYKTTIGSNGKRFTTSSVAQPSATDSARRTQGNDELDTHISDTTTINTSSGSSSSVSIRSFRSEKNTFNKFRRQPVEGDKLSKQLRDAVLQGKSSVAESLCSNGADPNYRYSDNSSSRNLKSVFGRLLRPYGCAEPTLLHHAAEKGNKEIARILLTHGADQNARDRSGKTPLHLAGDEIADLLLLHGADPLLQDNQGATPLHHTAATGHLKAAAALIQAGSNVNAYDRIRQTPLHLACVGGHRKVVSLLIEAGAYVKMVDADGLTPLHSAAKYGHDRIVRGLLRAGTSPEASSSRGWRPIHYAACGGFPKVLESLLDVQTSIDSQTSGGGTALHLAISSGQEGAVKLLLEGGADLEKGDEKGNTPICLAVASMQPGILSLLLEHGAQVNAAKRNGDTAILEACRSRATGQTAVSLVRLLLENGSRVNLKNVTGYTPLQAACSRAEGGLFVARLLLSHGARVRYEDYICLWRNRNIPAWERGAIKAELDVVASDELKKDEVEWVMIAL